jgi:hypothetical protein
LPVLWTIVVILVIVLVVMMAAALAFRAAGNQGVESEMVLHTHDELSQRHLDDELGDLAITGVDVDGRLADTIVPEPDGAPPVPGAQWDEQAGRWIHWDEATDSWIPVPDD